MAILIACCLVTISGCLSPNTKAVLKSDTSAAAATERYPETNKYSVHIADVVNNGPAQAVTDTAAETIIWLLNLAEFDENTKVSMTRIPDYELSISVIGEDGGLLQRDLYRVWHNSNSDQIELVDDSKSLYGILSLADSTKLLELIRDANSYE